MLSLGIRLAWGRGISPQVALLLVDVMSAEDAEEPGSLSWVALVDACALLADGS